MDYSVNSYSLVIPILLSLSAGLAITCGAWFASKRLFHNVVIEQEIGHGITAFGGGALISAIAFVLIPESIENQSNLSALLTFAAGGIIFMAIDMLLARMQSSLSQLCAMMLDFVPEAIVLGVVVAESPDNLMQAVFITAVIIAQNIPEGYTAYKEASHNKSPAEKKTLLYRFLLIGMTGPCYLLLGTELFVDMQNTLAMMMTFCAGGILYLVFEDVAPQAVMQKHWLPPLGALGGFMVGMSGFLFFHG